MTTELAIFTGVMAFLAIGMTTIAFWQKKAWVFMIAAILWVVMGVLDCVSRTTGHSSICIG